MALPILLCPESLPSLQRDQERATALVAHPQAFLRHLTVDLALDGEQDVDALDRFDGNRRLVEPGEVEELASCMRPACCLDDRTRLAARAIEPVERRPPASARHNSPGAVPDVWRHDRASRRRLRPEDRDRQRADRPVHRSTAARCGSALCREPARSCRRRGCARPQRHAAGSKGRAASAWRLQRRPNQSASRRRDQCPRGHRQCSGG